MRSQNFARHSLGMAEETQDAWPYRELLARKLRESGLSARKAAEKMRITDTRLRHIVNGYQPVGRGQRIEVVAPGDTLADIAMALDITPDEMEAAGRKDAAEIMRKVKGLRPMDYAIPGDEQWNRILAVHDEIRAWAEEGIEIHMPPDGILELFDDEQLLAEVGRRIRFGSPYKQVPLDDDGEEQVPPLSKQDVDLIAHDEEHSIEDEQGHDETP